MIAPIFTNVCQEPRWRRDDAVYVKEDDVDIINDAEEYVLGRGGGRGQAQLCSLSWTAVGRMGQDLYFGVAYRIQSLVSRCFTIRYQSSTLN